MSLFMWSAGRARLSDCGRFVLAIMLFASGQMFGQRLTFARYSSDQKPASSWIYGVSQDSTGFIWVASGGGLQKFDGYSFTFLRGAPSSVGRLQAMPVLAVHVDRSGVIWAGTYTAGLARVDPEGEVVRFFAPVEGDTTSLSSSGVTSITSGRGRHLWISTINGFHRLDPATGRFQHYGDPRAPIVLHTMEDRRGTVWAGTSSGVLRLKPGAQQPELIASAEYLASPFVRKIYEDRLGRLWFCSSWGLRSYDPTTGRTNRYEWASDGGPNASILDVVEDPDGSFWVATHGGLYRLSAAGTVQETYRHDDADPSSISADDPSTLCVDRSGVLWVGTQTGWLNRAEVAKARFIRLTAYPRTPWSLSHRNVVALAAGSDGKAWFATPHGVDALDIERLRRVSAQEPLNAHLRATKARPTAVFEDSRGAVWVGTNRSALLRMNGARVASYAFPQAPGRTGLPDFVWHINEDRTGTLWIGTAMGGVRTFDRETERWRPYVVPPSPTQNFVMRIIRDRRGVVWGATSQGGALRISDDGSFIRLVKDSSWLPSEQVNDLAEDPDGRLWLATVNSLVVHDPVADTTHVFAHLDRDGHPTAFGSLLRADDGTWWAGSSTGLLRFDPRTASFRRFTAADGVSGEEFTPAGASKLSGGRMVFGGSTGATVVDPMRLQINANRPAVIITAISMGDSALWPVGRWARAGLSLPYQENILRISFASLDFRAPEMNRFRYRLEGSSDRWHEMEGRTLTLTHLDPGEYTLRAVGTNNDGVEGINEAALKIKVLPPWWQTWWFRSLLVLGMVMMVALLIRLRVAAIVREERLRAKIARDLHDDVSSTLSSILVFAEAVRTDRRRDAGRRRHYLDLIAESARSARDMIGDIIWSVDPQHDDWPSFLSKCERYASDLFESAGIGYDLQIEKAVSLNFDLVLRRNLWLIFKEIVTNLVRHSNATRARVIIRSGDGHLIMAISDDGRGFDRNRVRRGNGLSNIERRAGEIGAAFEVESRPGGGTTWKVQLRKGA